eukprot:359561_1
MGGSVSLEDDLENTIKDNKDQPVIGHSSDSALSSIHVLIYGYIRKYCYITAPEDIVNICIHFYCTIDLDLPNLFIITDSIEQLLDNEHDNKPKSHGMCIASSLNNLFISKTFQDECSKFNIKNAMALIQCGTSFESSSKNCSAIIFDHDEIRNNKFIENAFKLSLPPLPIVNSIHFAPISYRYIYYRKYITKSVYSQTEQCIYSRTNAKDIFKLNFRTNKLNKNQLYWESFQEKSNLDFCVNFELCLVENDSKLLIMDSEKIVTGFKTFDIASCTYQSIRTLDFHQRIYSNLCYDCVHNNVYFGIERFNVYCYDLNKDKFKILKPQYHIDFGALIPVEYEARRSLWMNGRLLYIAKPNNNGEYTVKYYDTRTNGYKWMADEKLSNLLSSVPNFIPLHF